MKLVTAFLLIAAGLCFGEESQAQRPLITVSGTGEVRVVPDEVNLRVGVEIRNRDLSLAVTQQNDQVKAIIALARKYGVEDKDIQTDYISINPQYSNSKAGRVFEYYKVDKSIALRLVDVKRFDELMSGLILAGANHVYGVRFATRESRKYRDQARELAVAAAREKAEAMAGRLGQKIGKAYTIEEEDVTPRRSPVMYANYTANTSVSEDSESDDEGGTLMLGRITMQARVKVSFELP